MGSEFDVDAAIKFARENEMVWIAEALEAGRVPSKPEIVMPPTKPCGCLEGHKCAADDTIRISRKVAEHFLKYWATMVAETKIDADKQMVREIRKAIGSDE